MRPWKLKTDIYPIELYLFPPCTREDARKYIANRFPGVDVRDYFKYEGSIVVLSHAVTARKVFFIWLEKFNCKDPFAIASLCHEVSHIVGHAFRYLGLPLDDQASNEHYAYYLGFLVEQCVALLMKRRRK